MVVQNLVMLDIPSCSDSWKRLCGWKFDWYKDFVRIYCEALGEDHMISKEQTSKTSIILKRHTGWSFSSLDGEPWRQVFLQYDLLILWFWSGVSHIFFALIQSVHSSKEFKAMKNLRMFECSLCLVFSRKFSYPVTLRIAKTHWILAILSVIGLLEKIRWGCLVGEDTDQTLHLHKSHHCLFYLIAKGLRKLYAGI